MYFPSYSPIENCTWRTKAFLEVAFSGTEVNIAVYMPMFKSKHISLLKFSVELGKYKRNRLGYKSRSGLGSLFSTCNFN